MQLEAELQAKNVHRADLAALRRNYIKHVQHYARVEGHRRVRYKR